MEKHLKENVLEFVTRAGFDGAKAKTITIKTRLPEHVVYKILNALEHEEKISHWKPRWYAKNLPNNAMFRESLQKAKYGGTCWCGKELIRQPVFDASIWVDSEKEEYVCPVHGLVMDNSEDINNGLFQAASIDSMERNYVAMTIRPAINPYLDEEEDNEY